MKDVEYLLDEMRNQGKNNQIYLLHDEKVSKVKREDYYPDENGVVVFHADLNWRNTGYSVYEMEEFLSKYGEKISKVLFEDCEGNTHEVISVYESDAYSSYAEYSCVIKIGVPGQDTYKREGIVDDSHSFSDMMYTSIFRY